MPFRLKLTNKKTRSRISFRKNGFTRWNGSGLVREGKKIKTTLVDVASGRDFIPVDRDIRPALWISSRDIDKEVSFYDSFCREKYLCFLGWDFSFCRTWDFLG